MSEPNTLLLKVQPETTAPADDACRVREAGPRGGDGNETYEQYLLRLTELEVAARSANVLKARIKQAASRCTRTSTPTTSRLCRP